MQKGLLGYYLIYPINNYILNDHVVEIYACRGGQVWWGAPLACKTRYSNENLNTAYFALTFRDSSQKNCR
jgi:hypothetical protein